MLLCLLLWIINSIPLQYKSVLRKTVELSNLDEAIADSEDSIFFIETDSKRFMFEPRHWCAFESAARHNPSRMVGQTVC